MGQAKGLIVKLSDKRAEIFRECVKDDIEFTEPVPDLQHSNSAPLWCFITELNLLTYISFGTVGQRAGTALQKVTLSQAVQLRKPIDCHLFTAKISGSFGKALKDRFENGGLLTPKALEYMVQIVMNLAPETHDIFKHFDKNFETLFEALSSGARANLALQKEAVLTALLLAGEFFDRKTIQQWTPTEKPSSFLDGLKEQRLEEGQMIRHDFQNLPGFSVVAGKVKGSAVFSSPFATLTVIYADKEPLERLTGADLIYYNETYKSFVFVQYKVMDKRRDTYSYYPDSQLQSEIQRIETLLAKHTASHPGSCSEFRLHDNPFFLKLCPRMTFVPESSSLTKGMYIPLEYWKIMESSSQITGPRGGKSVTFENVGRYLTNTEFATLVAEGWVGSTAAQSGYLAEIIKATLEAGRAAIYAVKEDIAKAPKWRGRFP